VIVALGAGLRLYRIHDESAWCDEILSIHYLDKDSLGTYLAAVQRDNPPTVPFYFVLQYAWSRVFNDSTVCIRMLSILIGCLTIHAVYLLGAKLAGRMAGLFCALLVALNPMHIYYSQEIRMYGLAWLLSVWSVHTLVGILTTSQRRWWFLHGLINLALLWTHLFNSFLIGAEGVFVIYYFAQRKNWIPLGQWLVLQVASVSTLAAWSLLLANHESINTAMAWVPPLSFNGVWIVIGQYLGWMDVGALFAGSKVAYVSNLISRYGLVLALGAAIALLSVFAFRKPRRAPANNALSDGEILSLLALWSFVPMLLLALVSVIMEPSFVGRYTGYCSLAFCLLLGVAFARIPSKPVSIASMVLVLALISVQTFFNVRSRPLRHGWNEVARCIKSAPADQAVFTNDPTATVELNYYLARGIAFVPQHADVDDWRRIMPFLSAQKSPGWMVFLQYYSGAMRDFEVLLNKERLLYTKNEIPGSAYPTVVYHIVPKPNTDRQRGPKP